MTTLELFKKHRKGEVSRERFLYEVRRDNNLPWVTNTTSYDDAVKILKNKGIIREAQFEPQNITTDPAVDRANPYALKREVQKLLAKEKELTNDSYKIALNKAAKKIAGNPQAIKDAMFSNADTVAKADDKLQMEPVKPGNHVDKDNGMKKMKGQEALKAMSAPTKENRKSKKPKGVEVMPDKGVEGSQKIIKEISEYIKKKLAESTTHDFHEGMEVHTSKGPGKIKAINGGTLEIELPDGSIMDEQMNTVMHHMKKKQEEDQMPKEESKVNENKSFDNLEDAKKYAEEESLKGYVQHVQDMDGHYLVDDWYNSDTTVASYQSGMQLGESKVNEKYQPDYYINVSIRDASRAIEIYRDLNIIPRESVKMDGTDSYVIDNLEIAQELLNAFQEENIEIIDTDVPTNDFEEDYEDDLVENNQEQINQLKAELKRTETDMKLESDPEVVEDYKERIEDLQKQIKDLGDIHKEDLGEATTPFEQNLFDKTLETVSNKINASSDFDDDSKKLINRVLESVLELVQDGQNERALAFLEKLEKNVNQKTDIFDTEFKTLQSLLIYAMDKFKEEDQVKFKEDSRYPSRTGKIHDFHDDGTCKVLLDPKGTPVDAFLVDLIKPEDKLKEFTTAKTKDAAHNADIMKSIDANVTNPIAKTQLKKNFNAGQAIDL